MNKFISLDVETANYSVASVCQIGMVLFENKVPIQRWNWLIDPQDYFDSYNIMIHGITKKDVKDKPNFGQYYNELCELLSNNIVVTHTAFDRSAIRQACEKYNLPMIDCIWQDSAKIARRTWEQFAHTGYGLANVSHYLNIKFNHHNAEEDALAAGLITIIAMETKNLTLLELFEQSNQPRRIERLNSDEINQEGILYGEVLVFTGELSMQRFDAANIAAAAGCIVAKGVTKKTTLLIVGEQTRRLTEGEEKSDKHRKAEQLVEKGQKIRILSESDFKRIVNLTN